MRLSPLELRLWWRKKLKMRIAAEIYILLEVGIFLIIAFLSWLIWDKRYRKNHGNDIPKGYMATDEVFIDPVNGKNLKSIMNRKPVIGFIKKLKRNDGQQRKPD